MSKPKHTLECQQLAVMRSGVLLFSDLSISMQSGDLLIIQGTNGSGKSTLLQALAGLIAPSLGHIHWDDQLMNRSDAYPRNLVYLGHQRGLYLDMTVEQNVRLWASLARAEETVDAALHYFDLTEIADFPVHMLSEGWRQRVALTRLLTMPGPLWVLDEPTANLDVEGISHLHALISTRIEQNGMVVMSTHAKLQGDKYKTLNINDYKINSNVIN